MATPSATVNKQRANEILCANGFKATEAQLAADLLAAENLIAYDTPKPTLQQGSTTTWDISGMRVSVHPDGEVMIAHDGVFEVATDLDETIQYAVALIAAAETGKENATMVKNAFNHLFGPAITPSSPEPAYPVDNEADMISEAMENASKIPGATADDIAEAVEQARQKFWAAQNSNN